MTHTHAGTDCFDPDCLGTDVILGDSELCGDEDPDTAVDAYSWKCRLPKNHSGSHVSTSGKKWENENVTQGGVPSDLDRDVGAWESKEGEFTERELADLASRLIAERKELRAENADLVAAWRSQQEDLERKTAEWNEAVRDAATAMGESLVQISGLQAENSKLRDEIAALSSDLKAERDRNDVLIAWQKAAAEERIVLRERLNALLERGLGALDLLLSAESLGARQAAADEGNEVRRLMTVALISSSSSGAPPVPNTSGYLRAVAHNASVRCTDCRTEMTQELPEVLRKDAAKS